MIENKNEISRSGFQQQFFKDFALLLILLLASFYFIYYLPQSFSRIFFLLVLFLFLFSKKYYFWFAYFFILSSTPGRFFAGGSALSQYRLPLYTFLPNLSFTVLDIFVIFALVKAFIKGKKVRLQLRKPLILIGLYMVFALIVSAFLFGSSVDIFARGIRFIFYYSIIISFSYLVLKKYDIHLFILLMTPIVFFILFCQIYHVVIGTELIDFFNPGYRGITLNSLTGEIRPVMGGGLLVFSSFIYSLALLGNKEYKLFKGYLYLIIAISFFSIFLSATRIWFVIFSFILISYIVIFRKNVRISANIVFSLFFVVAVLVGSGLISQDFLVQSPWGRMSQVFDIAQGDITSVDSARSRFSIQLPVLLEVIKKNPFVGYGFSDVARRYYDNDFGFLNTVLQFGILGFSLFIYFIVRYFAMIKSSIKRLNCNNPFKDSLRVLAIAWGGILIGYLSTWNFFNNIFFICVLIAISEFFVREANREELVIKTPENANL